jgi:4-amino-4-deoxychorismate lyase
MRGRILVNGRSTTQIDARDRGLQYGDGLFETLAVLDGEVRRLELHLERLTRGCARLGIASPGRDTLVGEIESLAADQQRAVLKLVVTRGMSARGLRAAQPTRILSLHPWPAHPPDFAEEGVAVRICSTILAEQPALAGIKHLNRLEQVVARREWNDPAVAEGLMRNRQGAIVCGTITNVFVVQGGRVMTPAVDRCGVAGTVRATVLERAHKLGIPAVQAVIGDAELAAAEEVFLTNALIGIWPVTRIGERQLAVGPLTRRFQAEIADPLPGSTDPSPTIGP